MRFPLYIWPQCVQRNQKLRAENMMIVSFKSIFLKQMILFHATTKSWRGSNSELGSIQGFHNVLRVRCLPLPRLYVLLSSTSPSKERPLNRLCPGNSRFTLAFQPASSMQRECSLSKIQAKS